MTERRDPANFKAFAELEVLLEERQNRPEV